MEMNNPISSNRLTQQVELFRKFLIYNSPILDKMMDQHNWDNDMDLMLDWIQVNWELLVERELLGKELFLTPLSIPMKTRVTNKDARPNFSVNTHIEKDVVDLKKGAIIPKNKTMRFCGFCSSLNNGFGLYPPFDLATLYLDLTRETFITPVLDVKFYLLNLD
jgi:hypothetical protein